MFRDEQSWKKNSNRLIGKEAEVISPASRFQDEPKSGQEIRFRMGDIYAPSLQDLFKHITPGMELEGHIVLLSDSGDTQAAYALVEVPGVLRPIIVPASCLELVAEAATGPIAFE